MKKLFTATRYVVTGVLVTVGLSFGSTSVAIADAPSPVLENGVYVITSALDDSKALGVAGQSMVDGANVQIEDRSDGDSQRFEVASLGDNQYSIINVDSGKSLDINGNSKKAGANVLQWTWSDSDNQRFIIEPVSNGGYTIQVVSSGLFLDVKGARIASGTNVIQWTSNGNDNQRWNFNSYDSPVSFDFETTEHVYTFQGVDFLLLDTYATPEKALSVVNDVYRADIDFAQRRASLPELTVETATSYQQFFIAHDFGIDERTYPLVEFFDFYENPVENQEIISQLHELDTQVTSGELTHNEALTLARMVVPTKPENNNTDIPVYAERNSGINLNAARKYAQKWATKINPKYGEEKTRFGTSADCTNFASQILNAGGVKMVTNNSVNKGWWWKSRGKRSTSWVNAHTFKNYMGSGYKTKSWKNLVANVRSGDFIGLDTGSDGTVDHIGFVHTKSGAKLKIAQHTRNYLKWNGSWPDHSGKGTYYRVRR